MIDGEGGVWGFNLELPWERVSGQGSRGGRGGREGDDGPQYVCSRERGEWRVESGEGERGEGTCRRMSSLYRVGCSWRDVGSRLFQRPVGKIHFTAYTTAYTHSTARWKLLEGKIYIYKNNLLPRVFYFQRVGENAARMQRERKKKELRTRSNKTMTKTKVSRSPLLRHTEKKHPIDR